MYFVLTPIMLDLRSHVAHRVVFVDKLFLAELAMCENTATNNRKVHQAQDIQQRLKITVLIEIYQNGVAVLHHRNEVNESTVLVLILKTK